LDSEPGLDLSPICDLIRICNQICNWNQMCNQMLTGFTTESGLDLQPGFKTLSKLIFNQIQINWKNCRKYQCHPSPSNTVYNRSFVRI
jgi:hypothetical protein